VGALSGKGGGGIGGGQGHDMDWGGVLGPKRNDRDCYPKEKGLGEGSGGKGKGGVLGGSAGSEKIKDWGRGVQAESENPKGGKDVFRAVSSACFVLRI